MPQPVLPSLDAASQRLAADNRRVGRALDQLPSLIENLVAAWRREDRRRLRELSQQLLFTSSSQPQLAEIAAELVQHQEIEDPVPLQRTLLALIGEAGRLRRRGILPAVALPAARKSGG